jgi:uncharacterized protein YodC (DUF2158 family)
MTYEAGDVVVLKSGGQLMTVASVAEDEVECIWCGEEGDFFRETIPTVALQAAPLIAADEPEEDDEEADEDTSDKRRAAS